ncbi:hypothetical protein H6P81_020812 [Aristolochia fimbriata]|uniref:Uncharacterized protein n=1 Tax=Aristolochia fimbriata TaxID=158543 RepID=A0AAV7DVG9_ARIFI|nr:hypothetical protein H6P81_020812 [Aristolochia fimbriata]
MEEEKKVVLVTGSAKGGIGYEYCKAFAEQNCYVFASDLHSRLHEIVGLPPEKVESLELNVSSDESVTSGISTIIAKCGRIDIVVNNAGVGCTGPLAELRLEAIRKAWEINTLGQLRVVQQVVPHMAARRSGCIVNIGSVVGRVPTPWAGPYCFSKAAVHAMSHTLRVELRPFGVDVVLVVPGAIRSNLGLANVDRLGSETWRLYKDFGESIAERAKASQSGKATDAGMFARHVVKKVLTTKPPKQIVHGHMTGLFKLLEWSPLWVRDLFFSKRFKILRRV